MLTDSPTDWVVEQREPQKSSKEPENGAITETAKVQREKERGKGVRAKGRRGERKGEGGRVSYNGVNASTLPMSNWCSHEIIVSFLFPY